MLTTSFHATVELTITSVTARIDVIFYEKYCIMLWLMILLEYIKYLEGILRNDMTTTKGDTMNTPIRHGEVILKPIAKLPSKATITSCVTTDTYRAADSDAGHHHVLNSKNMQVITVGDDIYVHLLNDGTMVHQKETDRHKDLPVVAGRYKVQKKTEYNPFDKVISEVKD